MKYRAVIFDIDGTLLDSVDLHAESWREVFASHGRNVPLDQVRAQVGKGGDQLLPVFFSRDEVKQMGEEMMAQRATLFREKMLPNVRPFPAVRPLFERLHADGYKIALASSATKEELETYVEILGVRDLVEAGASSDDAAKSKPHPDIFEAALHRLGKLPAEEVLAIGDTPYDVEAAAKIALRTIAMLCGGFAEDDLRRAGAMAIYRDPADLLARYEESPFHNQGRSDSLVAGARD